MHALLAYLPRGHALHHPRVRSDSHAEIRTQPLEMTSSHTAIAAASHGSCGLTMQGHGTATHCSSMQLSSLAESSTEMDGIQGLSRVLEGDSELIIAVALLDLLRQRCCPA